MFIQAVVRLVPLTLVLALLPASAAYAAPVRVGFDDLASGTGITTQYAFPSLPGKGVQFGVKPDGSAGETPKAEPNANATSAPNVAYVADAGGEFCDAYDHSIYGRFEFARTDLGVRANANGGTVRLRAYDGNGTLVAATPPTAAPGSQPVSLVVTAPAGKSFVFFEIEQAGGNSCFPIRADDLVFDDLAGVPLPAPDFGVVRDQTGQLDDSVSLLQGASVQVPLTINRFNGATGALSFAVEGLPPGVTATFVPNPTAAGQLTMVLKATKTAQTSHDHPLKVTATPLTPSAGQAPRTVIVRLTVHERYDMRVTGMEVSQSVQEQATPCATTEACRSVPSLPFASDNAKPRVAGYEGVRLAARKRTAVRVFTHMKAGDPVKEATVALRGFRDGKPLPGGPLVSSSQTVPNKRTQWVTWVERTDTGKSFDFILPPEWTNAGKIDLEAELVPPFSFIGTGPAECDAPSCANNNRLRTKNVPFVSTGFVTVGTARLWYQGEDVSEFKCCGLKPNPRFDPDPKVALSLAEQLLPLQEGGLDYDRGSYYATINVTDIKETFKDIGPLKLGKARRLGALTRLEDYADEYPGCAWANFCTDTIMGVYGPEITSGGLSREKLAGFVEPNPYGIPASPTDAQGLRATDTGNAVYVNDDPVAVTSWTNPVTGVHELSHSLGRRHADTACGGNSDGQVGENLTDKEGDLEGVGLDTTTFSPVASADLGSKTGTVPIVRDYMSYCPNNRWTAVVGWEKNFSLLRRIAKSKLRVGAIKSSVAAPAPSGAGAAASPANLLRVRAGVDESGARLLSVKPRRGAPQRGPAGSPLVVLTRDATGRELSRTPMTMAPAAEDGALTLASADVPSARVRSIELLRDGASVAVKRASAHAPRVKVLAPRRRARVGRGRETVVRWRATDADRDKLLIKVDYSVNDGRSWEPIHIGPDRGSARLPSDAFAGSRRARIRVRANDGFHESSARSARFRAVRRKPTVAIAAPTAGARIRADQTIMLRAVAHDDRRAAIRSRRRVSWFDGRRRLARGALTSATGLSPGRRRLRVVVRDGRGTVGRASVVVRVRPVRPQLLGLSAPRRISPRARSLRLRVRTTVPAALRVSGGGRRSRAVKVSRAARRVTVRVRPGRRDLRLLLRVSAGKRARTAVLAVAR